jgi:hypothetical protein
LAPIHYYYFLTSPLFFSSVVLHADDGRDVPSSIGSSWSGSRDALPSTLVSEIRGSLSVARVSLDAVDVEASHL